MDNGTENEHMNDFRNNGKNQLLKLLGPAHLSRSDMGVCAYLEFLSSFVFTDPSNPVFSSSVDLHSHIEYQKILPDSTTMVCVPK